MGKYIIDVGDAYTHHICGEGDMLCLPVRINEFEDNWLNTNIPLTPYTEPDTEKVREDAYREGREDGIHDGMCDAWEAAKKISMAEINGRCSWKSMKNIFGIEIPSKIFKNFTASEAIEKLKACEQNKEQQIQVGDEVITASGKAVVLGVGPVHFEYVNADGSNGFDKVKNAEKTGRYFSEIAEVLRKMGEG